MPLYLKCDEVDRGLEYEKKHFFRYHLYRFLKETSYGWLKLTTWKVTLIENKYCTEKDSGSAIIQFILCIRALT